MAKWVKIGSQDMLSAGSMQEVEADGQTILLVRADQAYYAVQPRCPHLRARLGRGTLQGTVITCPAHGSTFDVTDGRSLEWIEGLPNLIKGMARAVIKPKGLTTFEVKVENDEVWVDLG